MKNKLYKQSFGVQKFECENCGSIYETDEYSISKKEKTVDNNFFHTQYLIADFWMLFIDCDDCNCRVFVEIPAGNRRWEYFE